MTLLTHDLMRRGSGPWTCVNCGRQGSTIAEVSEVSCPNKPASNDNVIAAIEGKKLFIEFEPKKLRDLHVTVNGSGTRRAVSPNACFYCQRKAGELHQDDCVVVVKSVELEASFQGSTMTLSFAIDVPASWDVHDIEFRYNESTWCADNLEAYCGNLKEMLKKTSPGSLIGDACLCGITKVRFVRVKDPGPYIREE